MLDFSLLAGNRWLETVDFSILNISSFGVQMDPENTIMLLIG